MDDFLELSRLLGKFFLKIVLSDPRVLVGVVLCALLWLGLTFYRRRRGFPAAPGAPGLLRQTTDPGVRAILACCGSDRARLTTTFDEMDGTLDTSSRSGTSTRSCFSRARRASTMTTRVSRTRSTHSLKRTRVASSIIIRRASWLARSSAMLVCRGCKDCFVDLPTPYVLSQ